MSSNILMVSHGFALARLLGFGDRNFRINMAYIEYENTASPVAVPSFETTDGREYYDNLLAPKDYLRVPVSGAPVVGIMAGYEAYFTEGVNGNSLLISVNSVGSVGVNGVPFSNAANSRVYGIALVAAPVAADRTQDIIITRGYYAEADQMVKPPTGQVHADTVLNFGI